jgi:hypothetical protein
MVVAIKKTGVIVIVKSAKSRIWNKERTLDSDVSFFNKAVKRIRKELSWLSFYFSSCKQSA